MNMSRVLAALFMAFLSSVMLAGQGFAASCGNTSAGFEDWKRAFSSEARARGVRATTREFLVRSFWPSAAAP